MKGKKKAMVRRVSFLILAMLSVFLWTACLTREYTNPKNNLVQTPVPLQVPHESFENLASSRYGWLIHEMRDDIDVSDFPGGYLREFPGNFFWQKVLILNNNMDFSETDLAVKTAQDADKVLLPQIWPLHVLDQSSCRPKPLPECEAAKDDLMTKRGKENYLHTDRCMPCNMTMYREFVVALVERYDGDNNSDMPGLRYPLKVWDFYDQPSLRTRQLVFFAGTPDEYIELIEVTHDAMKEACSDCLLMHSTFAAFREDAMEFWEYVYPKTSAFEVVNMQASSSEDYDDLGVREFRRRFPNELKPLWVTRTSFVRRDRDEALFAQDMVKEISSAFASGAQVVFIGEPEMYAHPQLIEAARTLIRMTDGFESVQRNSDGSFVYRFADGHQVILREGPLGDTSANRDDDKEPSSVRIFDLQGNEISMVQAQAGNMYYIVTA